MLKPAILAFVRQILSVAGTALVAQGYVQASDNPGAVQLQNAGRV